MKKLTLFDLLLGQTGRIERIHGKGQCSIRQRLLDMGVTRGALLRVERHAPLGDPIEISIKGYKLALRLSEASQIEVVRVET